MTDSARLYGQKRSTQSVQPIFGGNKHPTQIESMALSSFVSYKYKNKEQSLTLPGVWPRPCPTFRRALALLNFSRRQHEKAKGFLSYRIADRRGDHFDHRGHCNSEPPPVSYGRERGLGSGF